MSPNSSTYEKYVSNLKTAGLIDYPSDGLLSLTAAGAAASVYPEAKPTLRELHDAWRRCPALGPSHVKILDAAIAAHPEQLDRATLAERSVMSASSSTFEKYVSNLASLGALEYPAKGFVKASTLLFPEGLK